MNATFLTPYVTRAGGGIYEVERHLAHALNDETPVSVDVVGLEDEHSTEDLSEEWGALEPSVVPVVGPSSFGYAPDLVDVLCARKADLVHLHSLWMYTSIGVQRWRARTGKPYLITIHGMLDEWALNNARWKKKLAGWCYENANLRGAACLQVFHEEEHRAVREYGIDTPVCVIPNGVTLPPDEAPPPPPWGDTIASDQNVLLFLGRIHPKKGIFELVQAWKRLRDTAPAVADAWSIAIVGWDDGGYVDRLQGQIEEAGLTEDVVFLGPMFAEKKHAAFSHADAFVLPSYSEGFPMAILEAWSYRLPVLLTPGCNLDVGLDWNAAVETRPEPERLRADLASFLDRSADERREMGARGRRLVEDQFVWTQVAQQMYHVYEWMAGDAPPPETIRVD
jgi:poly(glycerol-phosphate) alpha-glucosyltransferase